MGLAFSKNQSPKFSFDIFYQINLQLVSCLTCISSIAMLDPDMVLIAKSYLME
jgi:hypothetical protein